MKTVIYLDELLLVNFLIAAFLLPGAGLLCGLPSSFWRTAAGAGAAALSSLLLLAPRLPFGVQLAVKALLAAGCVRVAFPYRGLRPFLRLCAWYLVLNLTLAGVVTAQIVAGGAPGMETNNLTVYFDVSPLLLLGSVSAVYAVLRLILWCFERPRPGFTSTLTFELQGRRVAVQAFCDTGLSIKDPYSAMPGMMVSLEAVKAQLPAALGGFLQEFFASAPPGTLAEPEKGWQMRFVFCETAAGGGLFPAVPVQEVTILQNGQLRCGRVLAVFCPHGFAGGCGAAYSPELAVNAENAAKKERGVPG